MTINRLFSWEVRIPIRHVSKKSDMLCILEQQQRFFHDIEQYLKRTKVFADDIAHRVAQYGSYKADNYSIPHPSEPDKLYHVTNGEKRADLKGGLETEGPLIPNQIVKDLETIRAEIAFQNGMNEIVSQIIEVLQHNDNDYIDRADALWEEERIKEVDEGEILSDQERHELVLAALDFE